MSNDVQPQIFYLDESCDECLPYVRMQREEPWKRVQSINAKPGDRVVINDVEYIVDDNLNRRRLRKGEKSLWKSWDIPSLGHIPDPVVIEKNEIREPIHCLSLKALSFKKK